MSVYRKRGKRALDIIATIASLPVVIPTAVAVILLVRWRLGRPIFYTHQRPGIDGQLFTLYKFRTMTNARDSNGRPLPDDVRLTPFGRWLRASSLDELPELWNVLKGDMSLVGPRPLLCEYLALYTPEQAQRHDVRPGITGWAQINGRNAISWEQKFSLDVWYVNHCSLLLDLKILSSTLLHLVRPYGISEPGQATATPFQGTKENNDID